MHDKNNIIQKSDWPHNMNIQLYHKPNSRSQRIVWFFEELELNYSLVNDQDAFETQARQLQHTHPLAKFPT